MKESKSLTTLLGFTQEELALVFNISRSQFSKYELGTRKLPQVSKQLLAEMVQHIYGRGAVETNGLTEQHKQKQEAITSMLKENDYQQELTTRRIATMEKKYMANLNALELVEFLTGRTDESETGLRAILRTVARRANKILKTHGLAKLFRLKLKLELLQKEKELLEAEAGK